MTFEPSNLGLERHDPHRLAGRNLNGNQQHDGPRVGERIEFFFGGLVGKRPLHGSRLNSLWQGPLDPSLKPYFVTRITPINVPTLCHLKADGCRDR